jgi:hypothetical protein
MGARILAIGWRRTRVALLLGVGVIALGAAGTSGDAPTTTYGVHRGSTGTVVLDWVLCDGYAATVVELDGYVGGSSVGAAVPVYWQIRSAAAPSTGSRVEQYTVGSVPDGWYETVALTRVISDDLTIESPPGDWHGQGMSFQLSDLRTGSVYRGDYTYVSTARFGADGMQACPQAHSVGLQAIGVVALGLGGLLAVRRRAAAIAIGILALSGSLIVAGQIAGLRTFIPPAAPDGQERTAFGPSASLDPASRAVLGAASSENQPDEQGAVHVRVIARGAYSFLVRCHAPSIQIGEASEIEDGMVGGRQIVGCSTGDAVRGIVADSSDRSALIDVVVNPNGATDWEVLIVEGPGEVGPFVDQ